MSKTITKWVTANASWSNGDVIFSQVSTKIHDLLNGAYINDQWMYNVAKIICPPPDCPAVTVIPQSDGSTNIINIQLNVPIGTTDQQIINLVTAALLVLNYNGKEFPVMGVVTVNNVVINN